MQLLVGDWVDSRALVISREHSKSVFRALASSKNGVTLSGITLSFLCCTLGVLPIAVIGIRRNQVCDSLLLSVENRLLLPIVLALCHMFASLFHQQGYRTGFGLATPAPPSMIQEYSTSIYRSVEIRQIHDWPLGSWPSDSETKQFGKRECSPHGVELFRMWPQSLINL